MSRTSLPLVLTLRILTAVLVVALTLPAPVAAGPPKPVNLVVDFDSVTTGIGSCSTRTFSLPPGVRFVLDGIQVGFNSGVRLSNQPRASLGLQVKTGDGTFASVELGIPMDSETGFGGASGRRALDIVAIGNAVNDAKVGDVFSVRLCLNRGSAASGAATAVLSGHR